MAITKEIIIGRIEVVGTWNVQVATDTVIKEDGVQISTSRHRHILHPCKYKSDGSTWEDTDISTESKEVQAVCNAVWTDTVKTNYKSFVESQGS